MKVTYENELFLKMHEKLGIRKIRAMVLHPPPHSNGIITIRKYLFKVVKQLEGLEQTHSILLDGLSISRQRIDRINVNTGAVWKRDGTALQP